MPERPDFERVLAEHRATRHATLFGGFRPCRCSCGLDFACPMFQGWMICDQYHRTHLAAALSAEVARWLADRDTARTFLDEWVRPYFGDDRNDAVSCVSRVLVAALAPTDTTAEEKGAGR